MRTSITILLAATAALTLAAGCRKEAESGAETGRGGAADGELVLGIERGARDTKNPLGSFWGSEEFTKTCLGSDDYICWSSGDQVKINGTNYNLVMVGTANAEASVSGTPPASNASGPAYLGYYPVTSGWWNTADRTVTLPATPTYTINNPMNTVPMYAESDSRYLEFRCPFGVMELDFKGNKTIRTIKLSCTSGNLSGTFRVNAYGAAEAVTGTGTQTVEIDLQGGLSPSNGTKVYVALAPGTYTNLAVHITTDVTDDWSGEFYKVTSSMTVAKGTVYTNTYDTENWEGFLMYLTEGTNPVYWSTKNLGATNGADKESWYGDYFAYASVSKVYSGNPSVGMTFLPAPPDSIRYALNGIAWDPSKGFGWCNTPYITNLSATADAASWAKYNGSSGDWTINQDDPARFILGGTWYTPNDGEWSTLNSNVTVDAALSTNSAGVQGYYCTSNTYPDRKLFFPSGGWINGLTRNNENGTTIYYMLRRTRGSSNRGQCHWGWVASGVISQYSNQPRCYGAPIRPMRTL